MQENKILIRKPFNEQYELTVLLDSKMVNSHMLSKTILRYDFTVITCNEDSFEVRLVLMDIHLDKSNNDLIKEVAQVTHAFNRMFSELHLSLSQNGKVLNVLNMDLILSKWNQTKEDMQSAVSSNAELKKLIAVNDSLFTNRDKLKLAIQSNEFLCCYFGNYFGEQLPIEKKVIGTNLFSTINMQWKYEVKSNVYLGKDLQDVTIQTNAIPAHNFSIGSVNAAYGQFKEQTDINSINPEISELANHHIFFPEGRLKWAKIDKEEIAKENELYMKIKYRLKADSYELKGMKSQEMLSGAVNSTPRKKIFLDERKSKK